MLWVPDFIGSHQRCVGGVLQIIDDYCPDFQNSSQKQEFQFAAYVRDVGVGA